MSDHSTLLETTDLAAFEFDIPCDSTCCRATLHKDAHPADYLCRFTCGDYVYWCQERWDRWVAWHADGGILECNICTADCVVESRIPIRRIQV